MNKWIIIEDNPNRAQHYIANIFNQCVEIPEIIWFYVQKDVKNTPYALEEINEGDSTAKFSFDIEISEEEFEKMEGPIKFCWCKDEEEFDQSFDKFDTSDSILLLDFHLTALGTPPEYLHPKLISKAQTVLDSEKTLIVFISNQVSYNQAKKAISKNDKRILAIGEKDYDEQIQRDCYGVVNDSISSWKEFFGDAKFDINLDEFFEKMKTVTIDDGHNWSREDLIYDDKKKLILWDEELNMPCQLVWLSQFLKYRKFAEDLLEDNYRKLKKGSVVQECLKTMCTKDSQSFSVLAAFFICWAAYRKLFGRDEKDQNFKNALLSLENSDFNSSGISRTNMVTPPQSFKTLKETGNLLYKMMYILFKNKKDGKSNLVDVKINEISLEFELRIAAKDLNSVLREKYENQILRLDEVITNNGGDATTAILKFFRQVQFSDGNLQNKKPFLGSNFKLINMKNGIIKMEFG